MKSLLIIFYLLFLVPTLEVVYADNIEPKTEKKVLKVTTISSDIAQAFVKKDYSKVGELIKKHSNNKIPNTEKMVTTITNQLKYVEDPASWKLISSSSFNRDLLQFSYFYIRYKKLTLFFKITVKNDSLVDIKYNTTPREIFGKENSNFFTANENIEEDSITEFVQKIATENNTLFDLYHKLAALMTINVPFTFKETLKDINIIYMQQYKSFYLGKEFEQRFFLIQARSKDNFYTELCSIDFHKNSPTDFYINSWNCSDF